MTKDKILERHKASIDSASAYDHTSIVCNVAETWSLIEDIIKDYEQQVDYWKRSFNKQVQAGRPNGNNTDTSKI